jgi:hypothetical protein
MLYASKVIQACRVTVRARDERGREAAITGMDRAEMRPAA